MINQEKWIHTIQKNNIKISGDKESLDYDRWTNTIPKKKNYNPVKKYSIVTILLVFGFLFVSVIKNETRDLQKKINFLKAEINGIEFNVSQSLLDNEVITSPENISRLAEEYLNINLVSYKKKQIIDLNNKSEKLSKISTVKKETKYKKKIKKLSGDVKYKVSQEIQNKKEEIKKLQEIYNNPKSIPREIKTEVAKKIKEKKSKLKNLYDSPGEIFTLERAGKWGIIQIAKAFLGIPMIPGK